MCGCNSNKTRNINNQNNLSYSTPPNVIRRIVSDPWIVVRLIDESVTTERKIFSGTDNLTGAYLGKHKYNDIFRAPASVLIQDKRFMKV